MIVLDASVLIAHLDAADALHTRATDLLADLAADDFAVSVLTLAEVLVGPARAGRIEAARQAIDRLDIIGLGLGHGDAERLATVRADTGLRMPDCCVLLAADSEAAELATFDGHLAEIARSRGMTVHDEPVAPDRPKGPQDPQPEPR